MLAANMFNLLNLAFKYRVLPTIIGIWTKQLTSTYKKVLHLIQIIKLLKNLSLYS